MSGRIGLKVAVLGACICVVPGFLSAQVPTPKNAALGPGDHRMWLDVGELRREFLLHVPSNYNGNMPVPLVLMFHGSGGSLDEISRSTGWSEKADLEGFLAVYPNGFPNADGMRVWNDGRPATDGRVDDVAFVRAMLDDLSARFRVDLRRVFVVGFSNGAGLAFRLAIELGNRIAAIAPVAGRLNVVPEKLSRAVPALAIIGTEDPGFRSGAGGSLARWAALLGCGALGEPVRKGRYTAATWTCPKNVDAVSYTVEGWAHYWPGGKNRGIEMWAENVIWRFFEKHPMPK